MTQVSQSASARPPNENNVRGLFILGKGWKLIKSENVDSYKGFRESTIRGIRLLDKSDIEKGCSTFKAEDRNNCYKNKLNKQILDVVDLQNKLLIDSTTLSDGQMFFENKNSEIGKIRYVPSQSQLTEPRLLLDVQAKWIGVRVLVSKPVITKSECKDFTQNGFIKVAVKNDGPVSSRFGVKLDSCGSFNQLSEVKTQTIGSQSISEFFIPIDSKGLSKAETCYVTAFNTELPETLKFSDSIICESLAIALCNAGDQITSKFDNKNCIKTCINGKYPENPDICCEKGIESIIEGGKVKFSCIKKQNGENGGGGKKCSTCDDYAKSVLFGWVDTFKIFKQPISCEAKGGSLFPPRLPQSNVICAFSFFKYLLVFIGLIFGTLFSFNLFQDSKQLKIKNRFIAFLISVALGLIIAVATFYLWWLGVIALISIIIIRTLM